jgi:hypothetical protein
VKARKTNGGRLQWEIDSEQWLFFLKNLPQLTLLDGFGKQELQISLPLLFTDPKNEE